MCYRQSLIQNLINNFFQVILQIFEIKKKSQFSLNVSQVITLTEALANTSLNVGYTVNCGLQTDLFGVLETNSLLPNAIGYLDHLKYLYLSIKSS